MCEQFIARSAEPFRLEELWPFAERLERFGIAGFGWGASWVRPDGSLAVHRHTTAFRDDPERDDLGAIETVSVLVHLRRPSRLSTLQMPDTQPFLDPAGRFAFAHNGDFRSFRAVRDRYRRAGRIHGRADSEVGQRWLEDAWSPGEPVDGLLVGMHRELGGMANLAVMAADGTPYHYAGNAENPVFTFRLGSIGVASTALYSIDRSLFRYAARGATERVLARKGVAIRLDEHGRPVAA
jgi:glutamine phosphoribosylpyrophosphate amidotransferase